MKKSTLLSLLLFLSIYGKAQDQIDSVLSKLPNLTFEKTKEKSGSEVYILNIKQPLDHSDTTKGFFHQKVYLSHRAFDRPTVIVTQGYNINQNREQEITRLLSANQLNVEHRFFGESMPDSLDYRYLNLEQATADLHKIRLLFSSIYNNKWVSTGISKGGVTTIFYKYFYPYDVDASIPYVAPINKSYEEQRIYNFLDTIGTDECRNKIKNFQIQVLKKRGELLPLLKFYSLGAKAKYTYKSLGEAFEYAVMEYPFSFWQYGHSCNDIPIETATIEELAEYLISVSDPSFYSDSEIKAYQSHYYQSATQMGYYGYETSEFKEYLVDLPTDSNPMSLFFTFNMNDKFDGRLLNDINLWLKTKGNKFIYIYGGIDTWSASAVPYNPDVDSEWFILNGKHHGNARIASMNPTEKKRLISTLEKWLSIKITPQEVQK